MSRLATIGNTTSELSTFETVTIAAVAAPHEYVFDIATTGLQGPKRVRVATIVTYIGASPTFGDTGMVHVLFHDNKKQLRINSVSGGTVTEDTITALNNYYTIPYSIDTHRQTNLTEFITNDNKIALSAFTTAFVGSTVVPVNVCITFDISRETSPSGGLYI
jgi:hypothetical protein